MAIPRYDEITLPLLQAVQDGKEYSRAEAVQAMQKHFDVSEPELNIMLPSGKQSLFDNRIGWAKTYLKHAGLIVTTRRGYFRITPRGLDTLKQQPGQIDRTFLMQFAEFRAFVDRKKDDSEKPVANACVEETGATPEEVFESSYEKLRDELVGEIVDAVLSCTPKFFENLVVDLLLKMGYGGSRKDAGMAIGASGDEGVDGIINEDRLGLDVIYIQAKRWSSTVGRPEIQKFAGALQGKRARKGVFITTSDYSREAIDFAKNIDSKIILIDGQKLAELMIDFNVGVSTTALYELKKVDSDYFCEE